jgi:protein-L-isoaspartate(D-aspartate) O-methyltransferase
LEIGTGSGYHAAIVSYLVGKEGHIYSIERIPALAETSKQNLSKAGITNVTVICTDGSKGYEKEAPYDRIYVTCASPGIPDPLIKQLKANGKLLIPVGDRFCDLQRLIKKDDKIHIDHLGGCSFVPLIGKYGY